MADEVQGTCAGLTLSSWDDLLLCPSCVDYLRKINARRKREAGAKIDKKRAGAKLVYLIGAADGPVKIGMAVMPGARLKELQTGHPHKLSILATAPGGKLAEREYHKRFASSRLHGEWFERTPELLAEITRLCEVKA